MIILAVNARLGKDILAVVTGLGKISFIVIILAVDAGSGKISFIVIILAVNAGLGKITFILIILVTSWVKISSHCD